MQRSTLQPGPDQQNQKTNKKTQHTTCQGDGEKGDTREGDGEKREHVHIGQQPCGRPGLGSWSRHALTRNLVWNEVMLIVRLWNMYCPAGGRIQSAAVTDLSAKSENPGTTLKIYWEFHIMHSHQDLIFARSGSLTFCHLNKLLQ